jgi:uncharacterized protein YcbK (DUF882 family)
MSAPVSRRAFLCSALAACVAASVARGALAQEAPEPPSDGSPGASKLPERNITLFNTHTNETASVVFKRGNDFDPDALGKLNHVLRDHRNGQSRDMDPHLFDQLFDLALAAKVAPDYEIISGYRSPESNSQMAARPGSGVSKNSLHMQGRAMDVRLKGCSCATLRDLALAARRGGVGYYERSNFVHIDTGTFRTWVG